MTRRRNEPWWHARAGLWISLALTAGSAFIAVKVQIANLEARNDVIPEAHNRELDVVNARLSALEARCRP